MSTWANTRVLTNSAHFRLGKFLPMGSTKTPQNLTLPGAWTLSSLILSNSRIWYSFTCKAPSGRCSEKLHWQPQNSLKCSFLSLEEVALGSQYHLLPPSHVCVLCSQCVYEVVSGFCSVFTQRWQTLTLCTQVSLSVLKLSTGHTLLTILTSRFLIVHNCGLASKEMRCFTNSKAAQTSRVW